LRQITFAVGSQLQYIHSEAFSKCPLNEVVVPASIVEIDPSTFSGAVWRKSVTRLSLIKDDLILSADSRILIYCDSKGGRVLIGSIIEIIGANASGIVQCARSTSRVARN
jgi:hypothetical protein